MAYATESVSCGKGWTNQEVPRARANAYKFTVKASPSLDSKQ